MTQRRFREFSTVTVDDRSMTDRSSIVTVLNSHNVMTDLICSRCTVFRNSQNWQISGFYKIGYLHVPKDSWSGWQRELNLRHFYTNPNFLLALMKDLAELFQKQLEVLKKSTFLFSYVWKKYLTPEEPIHLYLTLWSDIRTHDVIKRRTYTSSYT